MTSCRTPFKRGWHLADLNDLISNKEALTRKPTSFGLAAVFCLCFFLVAKKTNNNVKTRGFALQHMTFCCFDLIFSKSWSFCGVKAAFFFSRKEPIGAL